MQVRSMTERDFSEVRALWEATPGVGLNESDTAKGISAFLVRNPDLSCVAIIGGRIVGAVLCGHDGRRGYLHHLAVAEAHRGEGIARSLLRRCARSLAELGIPKCNVFLFSDNERGAAFWQHNGWALRGDLRVLQTRIPATSGDVPAA